MLNETVLLFVFAAGFLFGFVSFVVELSSKDKVDHYQLSTSIIIIFISTASFFIIFKV